MNATNLLLFYRGSYQSRDCRVNMYWNGGHCVLVIATVVILLLERVVLVLKSG